jgi:hypothetical protein
VIFLASRYWAAVFLIMALSCGYGQPYGLWSGATAGIGMVPDQSGHVVKYHQPTMETVSYRISLWISSCFCRVCLYLALLDVFHPPTALKKPSVSLSTVHQRAYSATLLLQTRYWTKCTWETFLWYLHVASHTIHHTPYYMCVSTPFFPLFRWCRAGKFGYRALKERSHEKR